MSSARAQGEDAAHLDGGGPVPVGAVVLGLAGREEDGRPALAFALHEARRRGVDLVVLHAYGQPRSRAGESWTEKKALEHSRRLVGRVALEARRTSPVEARTIGASSPLPPVDALLAASRTAVLLVLQSHGPLHPLLPSGRGRTAGALVARADCPVVVVPDTGTALEGHGIVVGVDEHGRSGRALRVALDDAVVTGDVVTALHAWDVWGTVEVPPTPDEVELVRDAAQRVLSEAVAGLQADYPTVELRREVVQGRPVEVLAEAGRTARLLVVGRHARSRTGPFSLGQTVRGLLQHARCPLAVVPPAVQASRHRRRLLDDVPVGPGF